MSLRISSKYSRPVRSSWIDLSDSEDGTDSQPTNDSPSYGRPRATTPIISTHDRASTFSSDSYHPPRGSAGALISPANSNSALKPWSQSPAQSPLLRSASEGAPPSECSFARPPKQHMALPDPAQFPDPYPYRPSLHHLTSLPALSSAGSSSASTRSSAYTSSGSAFASGDYGHVHVMSGDEEGPIGIGITSDSVVQMLANDAETSSSARSLQLSTTAIVDQSRWSESLSTGARSRSSSVSNNPNTSRDSAPRLEQKPSYDMGWQTVDERDEIGLSEDETDEDHGVAYDDDAGVEEERTSAAVIADEGRGLIVAADSMPIVQLQVEIGTTHLLIGSSPTPNALPSFLTSTLPQISHTLLALDISANFLGALPPVLAVCEHLEELNVASNPLRVLPVFLADLTNLRVLIADSTGIGTLPEALVDLVKLHTVSVRRNKMHSLPSWLCLLPALQTLCVDGNPFQGPWRALVEPLLAKSPMTPAYPPSTPVFPIQSSTFSPDTEADMTDVDDFSDHDSPNPDEAHIHSPEEDDHTITPEHAPFLGRAATSPIPMSQSPATTQRGGLARTRTTPNRAYFDQARAKTNDIPSDKPLMKDVTTKMQEESGSFGDRELRKMKSAGDLRRGKSATASVNENPSPLPTRPPISHYPTSLSSSSLLNSSGTAPELPTRFASLGPSSGLAARTNSNGARPQLTQSLWAVSPDTDSPISPLNDRNSRHDAPPSAGRYEIGEKSTVQQRSSKDSKEKSSRWGFLKKMSMGKMKPDPPSPPPMTKVRSGPGPRPHTSAGPTSVESSPSTPSRFSKSPQIDIRFSTTGLLTDAIPVVSTPPTPSLIAKKPSRDLLNVAGPPRSSSLLAAPSPHPRATKRRSFLPIDAPGTLQVHIPSPASSQFVTGVEIMNDPDEFDAKDTPSPIVDSEQHLRREEDRAREAYMRALRSVMAYLKDMNDLGLSQQVNPMSMYGTNVEEAAMARSRRPTVGDGQREVSMALTASTLSSASDTSMQLRSSESITGLRSGTSSQTLSVATTDSNGSSEERKFKDDKGKRAMVIREIIVTERTYVKGLLELMDIYIKPASVNVNFGVGTSKDTVVPPSERRVVFGGIDSLFSFHKDSFLPALEVAAAPLMKPSAELFLEDADGQLSLAVAKAVGNIFLKHAAFMRMYSSYINNFDSSVQRVKYWTSDRSATGNTSPSAALSPSSSTAQLVGLGLSMSAISSPGILPEGSPAATGVPNLSASQRRRIKSYLKRCRMNPRHTQLNLEGYLLLPVQRIPRYRLLLEELLRSTPPTYDYMEDPLDQALAEISSLANNMNEGKRESESRRKLVQWQARIRGKFPSPLVQPHRRLIMDGNLLLTRVVRKTVVSFEAINAQGDASMVQVDCLAPELTPRPLVGILCNDLLVLCRDPSEGKDLTSYVDLWAVLRMQTLPQPASIVHGNALRLVDNKAILYFDAPTPSDALNWFRAINLHIPASKT